MFFKSTSVALVCLASTFAVNAQSASASASKASSASQVKAGTATTAETRTLTATKIFHSMLDSSPFMTDVTTTVIWTQVPPSKPAVTGTGFISDELSHGSRMM